MKKLLFAAVTLDVGGIETALVTLLNYLAEEKKNNNYKYDITLVLEKKQGLFLDTLSPRVKIIEFKPCAIKFTPIRKIINFIKQRKFSKKNKNKYNFSASYATYSLSNSFVARTASQNSSLWCHMDYLEQFKGNQNKVKDFFNEKHFQQFKNIVFVSESGKDNFIKVFPNTTKNVIWINNLIDYKSILEKSKQVVNINKEKDTTIFLNLGRHEEEQKKLSKIIYASEKLKNDNLKFKVLFIGDGKDTKMYENMVKEKKLDDCINFLGRMKNPYPYIKHADGIVVSSDYEGSPVVFTEAMVLNIPVITTNVSGSNQIENKFGIVTDKTEESIYRAMKEFIKNRFTIKQAFNAEEYNEDIIRKIESLINTEEV